MNVTDNTPGPKPSARRKPYAPPRLISYGHVKDLVQGNSGKKGDAGSTKACWVAEALYGVENPRTIVLRSWLTAIHTDRRPGWLFVELYRRVGPNVAGLIRAGLLPRWTLLPLFNVLAEKAFDASARMISDERRCRAV